MTALPIDSVLEPLTQALVQHNCVLLSAEPGAGKTSRVPLALLDQPWRAGKKILMLEPRRLATRNAAHQLAKQLEQKVGQQVGYRMRLDNKVSSDTVIEVITEGVLNRYLQQDPALEDVACVIFDEFHERSLQSDLGLALCLQSQELFNPELKILIMSATLDSHKLQQALDCPLISCTGRQFAVELSYRPFDHKNPTSNKQSASFLPDFSSLCHHTCQVILQALEQHTTSQLVFLPGAREIEQVKFLLSQKLNQQDVSVYPLYGQLTDQQQQLAIQPSPQGQRKIVLATNIAESSLTIDGIGVVIDSGLHKQAQFQPRLGSNQLISRYISAASATQRMGRAGRLQAGHCYRLWSEQQRLEQHDVPEIQRVDLADFVIAICQWGSTVDELTLLDQPNSGQLAQAYELLQTLEIIDDKFAITAHGELCQQLPLSPRLAHMLIKTGQQLINQTQRLSELCLLAAVLAESNKALHSIDPLEKQLTLSRDNKEPWAKRLRQLAKQWQRQLEQIFAEDKQQTSNSSPLALDDLHSMICYGVSMAYPDRVAMNLGQGKFKLANGVQVSLTPQQDAWLNAEILLVSDFAILKQHNIIRSAIDTRQSHIQEYLAAHLAKKNVFEWNAQGQLINEQHLMLGQLCLAKNSAIKLSEQQRLDAWQQYFLQQGLAQLNWNNAAVQLQNRVQHLHRLFEQDDWPAFDQDYLLARITDWLLPHISHMNKQSQLAKLDIYPLLLSLLDWSLQQKLEQLTPTHFKVPSGARHKIDYQQNPPVLAVKLQEMFGCQQQPSVAQGRLPLLLHLLSPAARPIQITQDLSHFWQHTYPQVRKDMRGKYIRHPWPEDPFTFQATAKTNRALARNKTDK